MHKTTTTESTPLQSDVKADELNQHNLSEDQPREHVLKNILSFSASLKVEDSKHLGKIKTTAN